MQQARELVSTEFDAVNKLIVEQLQSNVPMVENIGHYIVDAGGKRMRPMLSLLSAGICGKISERHIQLAAVIEFIHTATLLHDDVVDISSLRRGLPTANAKWGNAPSVLVGDFLYSRAFQILVSIGDMALMDLLSKTTNIIAEGEVLQLTRAGEPDTSEATYYEVIRNKTAVLFAAACSGSAILSAEQALESELYDYGLNLGIAFQLIDDVLDYEGSAETMGKNVGDDLAEGKPTLPLIYVMENGSAEQAQLVADAIRNKSAEQLDAIVEAVSTTGALDYTRQQAVNYQKAAQQNLAAMPTSDYRDALDRILALAVDRQA